MPRIAYVNGRYLPHREATVHIEDRGYQFADGVYEVTPIVAGTLVDEALHLDRLERSLSELSIAMPTSRAVIEAVSQELMIRNRLTNGFIYIQVTRGVAPRDHKFPKAARPSLVMTTRQTKPVSQAVLDNGLAVVTVPDQRWLRRDIKSISLLPNVLAKQAATEQGAFEAWMVDEQGQVTEGSSTNAWIVTKDGKLVTRPANNEILNGITRVRILRIAKAEGLAHEERPFTVEEAMEAREALLTSSSNFIVPITQIDGKPVGNGHPGLLAGKLRALYEGFIAAGAGEAEAEERSAAQ